MKHLLTLALFAAALPAAAAVQTEAVDYSVDGAPHTGYVAYDDAIEGRRPGVLVVPEWWGVNDYVKTRARQLAEMGYVAFVADMYGQGKATASAEQAGQWSKAAKPRLRELTRAALSELRALPRTDPERIAAIGFCFGGTSVLELAYSGAEIDGVVSFHGNLPVPSDSDEIQAQILVLHGAADPFVPLADVQTLVEALNARQDLDWHLTMFGHAEHAFSNPGADDYDMDGVSYSETAARRAWAQMQRFFDNLFAR